MKAKQTQFVVLGLGRFGESVARNLYQMGRDVLAVDNDPEIIENITPYVTQAVQADVTDEAALCALPGVGPVLAGRIVAEREQNGAFYYPEDLLRVSGIGAKKLEQMRNLLLLLP